MQRDRGILRNESTVEGRRIWQDVELAASRAPGWLVERMSKIAKQSSSKPTAQPARAVTSHAKVARNPRPGKGTS